MTHVRPSVSDRDRFLERGKKWLASPEFSQDLTDGQIASGGLLTKRYVSIVRLLAEGLEYQEIASVLSIGHGTVKSNINIYIYPRLGVNSAYGAVAWSLIKGVIKPEAILPQDYEAKLKKLTDREKEVFDATLADNNREIPAAVKTEFIQPGTVSKYMESIVSKLDAGNTTNAKAMHLAYRIQQDNKISSQ